MSKTYGRLTVYTGPMFAGKTTEVLKRVLWAANGQSKKVILVRPDFDTRYSETKVVSHDGLSYDAVSMSNWANLAPQVSGADLVCFDEVQFHDEEALGQTFVSVVQSVLNGGVDVVCAGLDMDCRGEPFPLTARVMAMADEVFKLTANCTVCGRPATKTYRSGGTTSATSGEPHIELGAETQYEARCNDHWEFTPYQ